jgi:hypothetical protein
VQTFNRRLAFTLPIAIAVGVAVGIVSKQMMAGAAAAVFAAALAWAFAYHDLEAVGRDVKIASMTAIADAVGVGYDLAVDNPPALARFLGLGLLPHYNRSHFEDHFSGAYDRAGFDLYEAHLERETHSSKSRSYTTVFRGQVIRLAFPRAFAGVTVVRRDAGVLNMLGGGAGLQRIGLEDPAFEKIFEVYGTDQVEARYLVDPVFMERLLALETRLAGAHTRCAFSEGDLLIAIEGQNLFEIGDLFKPLADPERARRIVGDLGKVMHVMDSVLTAQDRRLPPAGA